MQQNQNQNPGQGTQQQDTNTTSDQPGGPATSPSVQQAPMSPGDEAPAGTPGTGEDICPACSGTGKLDNGQECADCSGTGKVIVGIGGA